MKQLLLLIIGLLGLALPAAAQNEAVGKLYTRAADGEIRAVLEIRITSGWHLYHTVKGHPDSISKTLELTFGGEGIDWGEPHLPEPESHDADYPEGTWDWVHYGKTTIYAVGRYTSATDLASASATMSGLTCSDEEGTCVPYEESLTTLGEGRDKHFADFPADLDDPGIGFEGRTIRAVGGFTSTVDWEPRFSLDDHVDARLFVRVEDGAAEAVLHVKTDENWHIYHGPTAEDLGPDDAIGLPTTVEISGPGFEFDSIEFPEPERIPQVGLGADGGDTWINGHHGSIVIRATGTAAADADPKAVVAKIAGQICDEVCLLFDTERTFDGPGPDELFAEEQESEGAASTTRGSPEELPPVGSGESEDGSLGKFLLLAVFWGLFTLLMPCTYPMIPITISFFTKQASARGGKVLGLSLAYGAGIVLIFILIGVVIGPPILKFAAHPVTNLVIGALFVFFAFVLFGAINLQPPQFLMQVAGKASMRGGYVGVFVMGATLVVTSFTCTAPFVGSLLAVGAEGGGGVGRIVLGMGVFGLTMATPFVLLSLLPGKMQSMPQAGEWMDVLKVFLGFVELAAALKFLSNADLMWDLGIMSREVFLVLWLGIFLCAAMFLFGWIRLKGKDNEGIGPVRMMGGVAALVFSLYCGMGVMGYVMDDIMTAIIPNYSSERLAGFGPSPGGDNHGRGGHQIVLDDYDAAAQLAIAEKKLLFVNFTGIT